MARDLARQLRARRAVVRNDWREQEQTVHDEQDVARALGGSYSYEAAVFDVMLPGIGIEVKTVLKGRQNKVNMKREALERKRSKALALGLRTYTVVIDRRPSPPVVYWEQGLGSFRLGNMRRVPALSDLRRVIR